MLSIVNCRLCFTRHSHHIVLIKLPKNINNPATACYLVVVFHCNFYTYAWYIQNPFVLILQLKWEYCRPKCQWLLVLWCSNFSSRRDLDHKENWNAVLQNQPTLKGDIIPPGGYSINQAKGKAGLISLSQAYFSSSCVPRTWLERISAQ